jgi:hypothetical protein
MAFIGSWVDGDAVCSKTFDIKCGFEHIRVVAAAAIAEGGYFVDVYR